MILLASSYEEMLDDWRRSLTDVSSILCINDHELLNHELARRKPPILLIDHDFLGNDSFKKVEGLLTLSPKTQIIISSPGISDEMEWKLFKSGIRGCYRDSIEPGEIKRVVKAVWQGELWIRRKLVHHMLDELVVTTNEKKQIERAVNNLLENLTKREYEIAILVGRGESNKQIARRLDITERTVKSHLTEIFRKLAITDRIKLALLVKDTAVSSNQTDLHNSSNFPIASA